MRHWLLTHRFYAPRLVSKRAVCNYATQEQAIHGHLEPRMRKSGWSSKSSRLPWTTSPANGNCHIKKSPFLRLLDSKRRDKAGSRKAGPGQQTGAKRRRMGRKAQRLTHNRRAPWHTPALCGGVATGRAGAVACPSNKNRFVHAGCGGGDTQQVLITPFAPGICLLFGFGFWGGPGG
jgi:hypothetical protein